MTADEYVLNVIIINGDVYGIVRFELPLFDEFVKENYLLE